MGIVVLAFFKIYNQIVMDKLSAKEVTTIIFKVKLCSSRRHPVKPGYIAILLQYLAFGKRFSINFRMFLFVLFWSRLTVAINMFLQQFMQCLSIQKIQHNNKIHPNSLCDVWHKLFYCFANPYCLETANIIKISLNV
jgi:hypothetical protein